MDELTIETKESSVDASKIIPIISTEILSSSPVVEQGKIAQIPYFVVDGHRDVFGLWYLSGIKRATLLHVDEHSDSSPYVPQTRLNELSRPGITKKDIFQYAQLLTNASFINSAIACGIIDTVLWIQPSTGSVHYNNKKFDIQETMSLVTGRQNPMIIDIDLDAFSYLEPNSSKLRWAFSKKRDNTEQKIQLMIATLKKLHRPDIITIARSQTPRYVPEGEVDGVQQRVITELNGIYK